MMAASTSVAISFNSSKTASVSSLTTSDTAHSLKSNPGAVTQQVQLYDGPKDEYEPHCWVCRNPFTTVKCSDCVKTYHEFCLKKSYANVRFEISSITECTDVRLKRQVTFKVGVCPECMICSSGGFWSDSSSEEVRAILIQMCRKLSVMFPYYNNLELLNDTVYQMDTNTMMKKVEENRYKNIQEFLCDAKWTFHNVAVYADAEYRGLTYNEILCGAKALLKRCKDDINDTNVCVQCFPTWTCETFNRACKKPHLLVWVTNRAFPVWPAKAYSITKRQKKTFVVVKFFGDKTIQSAKIENCFIFNEKTSVSKRIENALKECNEYIRNIEQVFGRVVLLKKDEKKGLSSNMSSCIKEMFPDYKVEGAEAAAEAMET